MNVIRNETEGFGYSKIGDEAFSRLLAGEEDDRVVEAAFSTFIQYLVLDTAFAVHDDDERLLPTPQVGTVELNSKLVSDSRVPHNSTLLNESSRSRNYRKCRKH